MNIEELTTPSVPMNYVLMTLEQGVERGLGRDALLTGLAILPSDLERPDARVSLLEYGKLISRVMRRSGDAGLGYDFGLRANLTVHGLAGFGMMNHRTLREVVAFCIKYVVKLRTPGFAMNGFIDGDQSVIDVRETINHGPLRQYAFDMMLVGMTHIGRQYIGLSELELWFDCPEPEHYARFKDRLPPVKFNMSANQIRCSVKHLDRNLETANPLSARLVVQQCEREMAMHTQGEPILSRVRAVLCESSEGYPSLEAVATRLSMSSRTLKRRLQHQGFTFRRLLDEIRRRNSMQLLKETTLSVEEVAWQLGYTAQGNFIRAFRSWTGTTPAAFRRHGLPKPPHSDDSSLGATGAVLMTHS